MASKSLLLLGLLFAIILVISSDVVSARNDPAGVAETKEGVQVDGWHGHHHHHHCHYPHCREEGGDEKENDGDHHEEAKTETTNSIDVDGDGHYKHKCKHWPHC